MDRTALWVHQHSAHNARQYQAERNALANAHPHLKMLHRPEGTASQQSSRTDLGGQDRGVGSGGRAFAKSPAAYSNSAAYHGHDVTVSRRHEPAFYVGEQPLSADPRPHHQRSTSHPRLPHDHRTPPRLNISSTLYRNPNLPAFVQGPPGSGYPMTMTSAPRVPTPVRATLPNPPSPPLEAPNTLNPKKSRPTVHRRRPSLTGATFEPPVYADYQQLRHSDERQPRSQGIGDDAPRRRGRSVSVTRR